MSSVLIDRDQGQGNCKKCAGLAVDRPMSEWLAAAFVYGRRLSGERSKSCKHLNSRDRHGSVTAFVIVLTKMYSRWKIASKSTRYQLPAATAAFPKGGDHMLSKIVSGVVLTGFLLTASAPVVFAATHKDKASCEKAGMKWDEATSKCVKK
jgi:hypothetical protein